jgi:hypothetical protein
MSIHLGTGIGRHVGMVLVADKTTGQERWLELVTHRRTLEGLTEHLRDGARRGRWFAWRIVVVESEGGVVGIPA